MMRSLLRGDFGWLLGSVAVSASGDWSYTVAFTVYVFEETGSPGWVAAASVLRLLPYVLFGTLGGAVADRLGPRTVMIGGDAIRAGVMLLLALVVLSGAPVIVGLALAVTSTVVSASYRPASASMTPAIVGADELAPANSAAETVENLALLLGPAAGGLLLTFTSPATAIALNGVTFAISAVLVMQIGSREVIAADDSGFDPDPAPEQAGLGQLLRSRQILAILAVQSAYLFVVGAEAVLYVLYADESLGTGAEGVGYLMAAIGLGGLLGAALPQRKLYDSAHPGRVLVAAGCLLGLPMALLPAIHHPVVAYLLLLVEGAGCIVVDVLAITLLQRISPPAVIGRVFGLVSSVCAAATILGSLAAGAVVGPLGLSWTLVLIGASAPAVAVLVGPALRGIDGSSTGQRAERSRRLQVLAASTIFSGATVPALEAVAAGLQEVDVPRGAPVIREGTRPTTSSSSCTASSACPRCRPMPPAGSCRRSDPVTTSAR